MVYFSPSNKLGLFKSLANPPNDWLIRLKVTLVYLLFLKGKINHELIMLTWKDKQYLIETLAES